ncbi:MAG: hypothetical protein ACI9MC_000158 [Kiritimatiellia bacterium]|jgi:hypothetical protein
MHAALKAVSRVDSAIASTNPTWLWLGQVALIILGTHLACDRLDDLVLEGLRALPLTWDSPDSATLPATWIAIVLELTVAAWATTRLWSTLGSPTLSWKTYKQSFAVRSIVRPLFWLPVALAGSWVIAMAVEDLVAPLHPWAGMGAGWIAGTVVMWRLGWSGLIAILATRRPKRRWSGVLTAPLLLMLAGLALSELPVWGWWTP